MTDINKKDTPTPKQISNLPHDMTANSLSKLARTLDPTHPAADLAQMNEKLLTLMVEEDDQACLLRRQAQTLDTLFHVLLDKGINMLEGENASAIADPLSLGMALKSQQQCFEIIKSLNTLKYMDAMTEHLQSKPSELLIEKLANRRSF